MESMSLDKVLERVAEVIGSNKDSDIAKALGSGRSTLSTWRKRGHLPYGNIIEFCLKRELPIESVLIGSVRKSERIYNSPEEALNAALEAQTELNLSLTADQIKSLLGYAYTSQSKKSELIDFLKAAFAITNTDLPTN